MIGGQTDYSLKTDYELVFLLKDDDRGHSRPFMTVMSGCYIPSS